ncbi:nSTAND1 domain-containing NTPase [Microbacterium sp. P5_E9]
MSATIQQWRKSLRAFEDGCFWPGTRAMRDPLRWRRQLIGRRADVERFTDILRQRRLVVLSGESGSGKSSFLSVGVRPQLARHGTLVLYCDKWSGVDGKFGGSLESTEAFIASKLSLPADIPPGAGFLAELDKRYGETAVIILDQFEELIRHQPLLSGQVQRWVEHAIATHRVRFVISLRSEYEHRVRYWRAGPWAREDFYLLSLSDPETIERIILAGRRPSTPNADGLVDEEGAVDAAMDPDTPVIEEGAVAAIVNAWARVQGGQSWSGVGLLHLQALLYVLWYKSDKVTVTLKNVEDARLRATAGDIAAAESEADDLERDRALFADALARAVKYHLAQSEQIYLEGALGDPATAGDAVMASGAAQLVTRIADYLASGGYKVDQDRRHLARLVLAAELKTLHLDPGLTTGSTAGTIFDSFAKRVDDFAAALDGAPREAPKDDPVDWLSAPRAHFVPDDLASPLGEEDSQDVTAGPMLGLSPLSVFVEELRRYFFALEWLSTTDLIRTATPNAGTTILSLIHDGFGVGLAKWAGSRTDWAPRALSRLTAAVGESFGSGAVAERGVVAGKDETFRILTNLRWRSCTVRNVQFRRVILVNCDLRESSFIDCEFEGVTFVNCLLDGVSFTRCEIRGAATPPPRRGPGDRLLPSFIVGPERDPERSPFGADKLAESTIVATTLNRYRETHVVTSRIGSWTSGLPASPISAEGEKGMRESQSDQFQFETFDAQPGGLVMYGGRLSSLMFAECTFHDDGVVSLRHVAGTSLEFAEQPSGRIELCDVVIRGLIISPPVGEHEAESPIQLDAFDSQLHNVWFSTPLKGRATLDNCVVWQLFSASAQKDGFEVDLVNSPHLGVINAHTLDDESRPQRAEGFVALDVPLEAVKKAAKKADYQSVETLRKSSPRPVEQ